MMELGNGEFIPVVWPTHVGAVLADGSEPMSDHRYQRGQITWEVDGHGALVGRASVNVPPGEWTHVIYCYHPTAPKFVAAQKLAHPLRTVDPAARIDLDRITEADVWPTRQPVLL